MAVRSPASHHHGIIAVLATSLLLSSLSAGCGGRGKDSREPGEEPEKDPMVVACHASDESLEGEDPLEGLTPPQMVATSKVLLGHMEALLERLSAARKVVHARDDVIRLGCVNDRYLEAKELLNVAETVHDDLVQAITDENDAARDRSYARIRDTYQSIWILSDEARECACDGLPDSP